MDERRREHAQLNAVTAELQNADNAGAATQAEAASATGWRLGQTLPGKGHGRAACEKIGLPAHLSTTALGIGSGIRIGIEIGMVVGMGDTPRCTHMAAS